MHPAAFKVVTFFCPDAADAGNNAVGMIVLQILRICTVITLVTMSAAYWVFIIKVDKSRTYFVFECASLFFNSIICLILILSEFPLWRPIKGYFRSSWPVLSEMHGVAWLGGAMLLLGCNIFGNLNTPANDSDNLTPPCFKLVLAAAILAFTFGVLNVVCSLVWRNGREGITSRDIRANGALAKGRRSSLPDYTSSSESSYGKGDMKESAFSWVGSKVKDMGKAKTQNQSIRPTISSPVDVESGHGEKDRSSPLVPGIQRPDTAMHPINLNTNSGTSSRYSDPDMSRF